MVVPCKRAAAATRNQVGAVRLGLMLGGHRRASKKSLECTFRTHAPCCRAVAQRWDSTLGHMLIGFMRCDAPCCRAVEWRLGAALGHGVTGSVYDGVCPSSRLRVAIKVRAVRGHSGVCTVRGQGEGWRRVGFAPWRRFSWCAVGLANFVGRESRHSLGL